MLPVPNYYLGYLHSTLSEYYSHYFSQYARWVVALSNNQVFTLNVICQPNSCFDRTLLTNTTPLCTMNRSVNYNTLYSYKALCVRYLYRSLINVRNNKGPRSKSERSFLIGQFSCCLTVELSFIQLSINIMIHCAAMIKTKMWLSMRKPCFCTQNTPF